MAKAKKGDKFKKYLKTHKIEKSGTVRNHYYDIYVLPFLDDLKELVFKGHTNKEIIELLEISVSTFYKWRKEKPEFNEIFENPEVQNKLKDELFDSLFARAKGFYVNETFENEAGGKLVSKTTQTRFVFSDKAAEQYIRNVLGGKSSESEITINFKNGDKDVSINFGSVDDEGDFDESN